MNRDSELALVTAKKKQIIVGLLDQLCQQLEITEPQYLLATSRYKAVGSWLADSNATHLNRAEIYPQGSIALATAIKPIGRNEFDVDLVCHLPTLSDASDARAVKALIGARLKENSTYAGMLEEKRRCWRLNYANEFHLDITPSIPNVHCPQGGELVPDKALSRWKPTNPKGYIDKFEQYAAITPRLYLSKMDFTEARADIAPLPGKTMSKPPLKRITQLLKRHRDQMFVGTIRADLAPISTIITTLVGWAYARCATQEVHTDTFDFVTAVIREMPLYIKTETSLGRQVFTIENETTVGENFADKWNSDPRLAEAFFEWHRNALASIESLLSIEGVDRFAESLSKSFGATKEQVHVTLASVSDPLNQARSAGSLAVAPVLGLVSAPTLGAVTVRPNTFFGR